MRGSRCGVETNGNNWIRCSSISRLVSSLTSRLTASYVVSFGSIKPPGNAHLPKWIFISPEDLARRIWNNVGYKTREINVPGYVACLGWAYQVIPGLGDWAIKKFFDFQQDKKNL